MYPSVMIVDDEPSILQSLSGILSDEGFEIFTASNGYEALKRIEQEAPDLVLLDIWMPGLDGIETLKEIKKNNPVIQVIIITGHGTIETAVSATKLGAFDLIEKPLSIDKVIVAINRALNYRRLEEENKYLRKKTIEKNSITGNSPATLALKKQIAVAGPTDAWILITGENGCGKELVARTIHQLSSRAHEPLVDVNCAAIPDGLIESELFGHEKGAFPGAAVKKRGKFELAGRGTLFLDEIGDMSLMSQGKILRVLQEKQFHRIGGGRTLEMDVRVIAATNKDIEAEIARGSFREDLYFRLNVIPIEVPPLRQRIEDLPLLTDLFLGEFARQNHCIGKTLTPAALDLLGDYSWPGNVRELKNLLERLSIMVDGEFINEKEIPFPINSGGKNENAAQLEFPLFSLSRLKDAQKAFEDEFIRRKLIQNYQDIAATARAIGVGQSHIRNYLKQVQKENKQAVS
jgi:two-component system, NtrC family, nitrogen regulation response regulator NtrX